MSVSLPDDCACSLDDGVLELDGCRPLSRPASGARSRNVRDFRDKVLGADVVGVQVSEVIFGVTTVSF